MHHLTYLVMCDLQLPSEELLSAFLVQQPVHHLHSNQCDQAMYQKGFTLQQHLDLLTTVNNKHLDLTSSST